jgi:nicotinate-nucleotide adenylyltransferase
LKIGIMGGTFDPIHFGHLLAAERAAEAYGLDEVWFMPANVPPHKQHAQAADSVQRWEMVRMSVAGNTRFRAVDIELRRGGTSYTADTLEALRREYPEYRFHYIIGADMVMYLPKWHRIDELAKTVLFIGLKRPGYDIDLNALPENIRDAVKMAEMPQVDISSTEIRERCRERRSIRYLVPDPVREFIEVKHLYES